MLSQRDRALVKMALESVPWSGGEDGVVALYELGEAIGSKAFARLPPDTQINALDAKPCPVTITRSGVELLVSILCGGGGALKPDVGPLAAELVVRIRKQAPRQETK